MRLSVKAFAVAAGLFWGVTLFVATLVAVYTGYLTEQLQWVVGLYPWYDISIGGALIGAAEGFIDGFFGGLIFAWLYNLCICCDGSGCCGSKKEVASSSPAPKKEVAKKAAPKRKPAVKAAAPKKKVAPKKK